MELLSLLDNGVGQIATILIILLAFWQQKRDDKKVDKKINKLFEKVNKLDKLSGILETKLDLIQKQTDSRKCNNVTYNGVERRQKKYEEIGVIEKCQK